MTKNGLNLTKIRVYVKMILVKVKISGEFLFASANTPRLAAGKIECGESSVALAKEDGKLRRMNIL